LPAKAIAGANTLLTPAQQQTTFAPTVATTAEGKTVTTKPSVAGEMPTSTIGTAGGLQGGLPTAGAEVAPGMRVPYPVRRADQPYIAEPTEQKDQTAGTDYRNNLVNGQMTLAESRRNVSEVMQTASGIGENLLFPSAFSNMLNIFSSIFSIKLLLFLRSRFLLLDKR
jgi:hypothetical protein